MENYFQMCLTDDQIRAISSIGLAHMGDAVFEILVRTWLCAIPLRNWGWIKDGDLKLDL